MQNIEELDFVEETVRSDVDKRLLKEQFLKLFKTLSDREYRVLTLRYFHNMTFSKIGKILGISSGRIGQLHQRALRKMRHPVRSDSLTEWYYGIPHQEYAVIRQKEMEEEDRKWKQHIKEQEEIRHKEWIERKRKLAEERGKEKRPPWIYLRTDNGKYWLEMPYEKITDGFCLTRETYDKWLKELMEEHEVCSKG